MNNYKSTLPHPVLENYSKNAVGKKSTNNGLVFWAIVEDDGACV